VCDSFVQSGAWHRHDHDALVHANRISLDAALLLARGTLDRPVGEVWERSGKTVVMVTHDVDEALYLADRLLLMTDGPEASVGEVLTVPFPRPRSRAAVLGHPAITSAGAR
jgi:ABC-type nitrate/sulfonate/bicarbonate transport system ATPase subunit